MDTSNFIKLIVEPLEEDWGNAPLLVIHTQVQQEFHQQLFVQKNPVLQQAPDFLYQPVDSDTVSPSAVPLELKEQIKTLVLILFWIAGFNDVLFFPFKSMQVDWVQVFLLPPCSLKRTFSR